MMLAYKLFKQRKDGTLGPLFIGARQRVPVGLWLDAEDIPTQGYAHRVGWHCGLSVAPCHLSEKGRVWAEVTIKDHHSFPRPKNQGGEWVIAQQMRVNRILSTEEVQGMRNDGRS